MKALILFAMAVISPLCAVSDKLYFNSEDLDTSHGNYFIHTGQNCWIRTEEINGDSSGMYTFESKIEKTPEGEYVKRWKCPYCNHWYDWGKPCTNKECPSKFK
jgi:hypothetical protein